MNIALTILVAIMALADPAPTTQPTTQPALTWGESVEGVQAAIVPGPTHFAANQRPAFTVAVRNTGKRDLFVARSQEICEIQVDGKWYQYFGDVDVKSSPLGPGKEYSDIRVSLAADWAPVGHTDKLKLAAGKHKLRVAITAQNEQAFEPVARAVTGEVEFEIEQ